MPQTTLGFIGLGKMGAPMAGRLVDAGHALWAYDADPGVLAAFAARGARPVSSPADLAARADTIFLCLPTPDVVHKVALGGDGLARGSALRTVIDLGTTGPKMTRTIAAGMRPHGITFVDSPVTGGVAGARAGTLAVMVSCPAAVFDEIAPLLRHLGQVHYTGEKAGLAQTAKLANNLLSAAALAVSSEVMAMGVKAGLDPAQLIEIFNAGSGRNSATEDKFPRAILTGTFDFGMASGLFLKDVRLCLEEAEALGVPMVAGGAVRALFAVSSARFGPSSDFTRIASLLEEWAAGPAPRWRQEGSRG